MSETCIPGSGCDRGVGREETVQGTLRDRQLCLRRKHAGREERGRGKGSMTIFPPFL